MDGTNDLGDGLCTLHGSRVTGCPKTRKPPLEHRQDILQRRCGKRTDDANVPRESGQSPLAIGGEQSFALEFDLQSLERGPQFALAGWFDSIDDGLKVAAGLVQGQPATHDDEGAVPQGPAHKTVPVSEHRAPDLRLSILQGEVPVARAAGTAEVGHFALDQDRGETLLDQASDRGRQFADRKDVPRRCEFVHASSFSTRAV